jgi:hypothetical protein
MDIPPLGKKAVPSAPKLIFFREKTKVAFYSSKISSYKPLFFNRLTAKAPPDLAIPSFTSDLHLAISK